MKKKMAMPSFFYKKTQKSVFSIAIITSEYEIVHSLFLIIIP